MGGQERPPLGAQIRKIRHKTQETLFRKASRNFPQSWICTEIDVHKFPDTFMLLNYIFSFETLFCKEITLSLD